MSQIVKFAIGLAVLLVILVVGLIFRIKIKNALVKVWSWMRSKKVRLQQWVDDRRLEKELEGLAFAPVVDRRAPREFKGIVDDRIQPV